MSKVIKYPVWNEAPHHIEAPTAPPKPPPEAEEEPVVDEEAMARMMAEIAAKEQRAQDMLKEAERSAALLKQEGQAEYDRLIEEAQKEIEALKAEARSKGYEDGMRQGREDGEQGVRQEMQAMVNDASARAEKPCGMQRRLLLTT